LNIVEIESAIGRFTVFAQLDDCSVRNIAGLARLKSIVRGHAAFDQGQPSGTIFLVMSGRFKAIQVAEDGSQIVTRLAGAGDLMGHLSAFNEKPYPVTAVAILDSEVLAWERRSFVQLLLDHPQLSLAIIRDMGKSIDEVHKRLHEASTEHVERRIAHAVLRLVRQAGRPVEGGIEIPFPITRQDIGLMSGATLHTVSRILSAWEQNGIVDGGRQHLVLRNPHAVVMIAEEQ
jgi:CRP/FNR family transcriptional regulator, nitrogen oxide reductase regulator